MCGFVVRATFQGVKFPSFAPFCCSGSGEEGAFLFLEARALDFTGSLLPRAWPVTPGFSVEPEAPSIPRWPCAFLSCRNRSQLSPPVPTRLACSS